MSDAGITKWGELLAAFRAEMFSRSLADAEAQLARLADYWQPEPGQETVTIPVVDD